MSPLEGLAVGNDSFEERRSRGQRGQGGEIPAVAEIVLVDVESNASTPLYEVRLLAQFLEKKKKLVNE